MQLFWMCVFYTAVCIQYVLFISSFHLSKGNTTWCFDIKPILFNKSKIKYIEKNYSKIKQKENIYQNYIIKQNNLKLIPNYKKYSMFK